MKPTDTPDTPENTDNLEASDEGRASSGFDRRNILAGLGAGAVLASARTADAGDRFEDDRPLAGKVAIVTGARNNLGRGIAVGLAELGADLLIHHHRRDTLNEARRTARMCRRKGASTEIYTADLEPVANVRSMFDVADRVFGRIDILVNNAGRIRKLPLADITEEEFERCNGINNKAVFFAMQEASRRMADEGRIINIGTSLLNASTPFYSAYAGTKAPMEEYTRMMSLEVGHRRITVNIVSPGALDTPFFHAQETPESTAYISNATPAKRLGRVSDIVPVVSFLATPEAQWVNGQTIWVNDGYNTR